MYIFISQQAPLAKTAHQLELPLLLFLYRFSGKEDNILLSVEFTPDCVLTFTLCIGLVNSQCTPNESSAQLKPVATYWVLALSLSFEYFEFQLATDNSSLCSYWPS